MVGMLFYTTITIRCAETKLRKADKNNLKVNAVFIVNACVQHSSGQGDINNSYECIDSGKRGHLH